MTAKYDALIIGAGHNGLVCAFYLARAGLKVRLLERRDVVGGAAVTEEFHPGFRNSVASYTVSLLQPQVIADMRLAEHGYRVIERPISNFLPQEDGGYLKLGGGLARTQEEFRKFSARDAETLPAYYDALETVAEVLRGLALKAPPNVGEGWRTLLDGALQGRGMARLSLEQKRDVLDLFTKSATSFLGQWFESEAVKAAFGFDAVVGNYASPDTPGSAYVLLHHVFGEVNGKKGAWGHSVGGMGAITQIMAKVCRDLGVEISLESPVQQVLVDGGRVAGVRLESGEEIAASRVIANVGPKILYDRMFAESDLPADFNRRMKGFKAGSGTFRMNVALSELPRFTCLPEPGEHHQSGVILAPTLDYMDRAFLDAKQFGWSKKPIVEMLIPSTVDDSLALRRPARRQPVLPAVRPRAARRPRLGRRGGRGGRHHHRHRRGPRSRLPRLDPRPPGAQPQGPRAQVQPRRRRHHARQHDSRPVVVRPPGARPRQRTAARSAGSTCAVRAPIPAAASPARRATTARKW